MLDNEYAKKLIYTTQIYKINPHSYIKVKLCEKRNNKFYEVTLNLRDKEIFLGKFDDENKLVRVAFKDGKILIYYEDFIEDIEKMQITEVLALYDVLDDTFYSLTEEKALELFDKTINSLYLKNKNKELIRSDIDKKKTLNLSYDYESYDSPKEDAENINKIIKFPK